MAATDEFPAKKSREVGGATAESGSPTSLLGELKIETVFLEIARLTCVDGN
jgi:hypothetical protein